jgi:glutamate N-acetyltransferase/amino-acid N-acetyltransferase
MILHTDYSVPGFLASAVSAGLKKEGVLDLSLIFSQKQAMVAGIFTTNKVKAAPVLLSQQRIKRGFTRAVIANTGYANACTGERGFEDAEHTAALISRGLEIDPEEVLVASTGVIGAYLPLERIEKAVPQLIGNLSPHGFRSVANALMTTDSFPKISYFEGTVGKRPFHLLGLAKGAGMIMPNMATMLSFLVTDLEIDYQNLWSPFRSTAESTFNRITVDGETSTNDMVLIMANGAAENGELSKSDRREFERGLSHVMGELASMIAQDGEGASRAVIVELQGGATKEDAHAASRAVANSILVKTAIFGRDANWGRIMAALGRSGVTMEENKVNIWINGTPVVHGGLMISEVNEKEASKKMKTSERVIITIDLNQGECSDKIMTCDLTPDYIRINADYRT